MRGWERGFPQFSLASLERQWKNFPVTSVHTHFYKHLIGKRENECDNRRVAGKKRISFARGPLNAWLLLKIRIALWPGLVFLRKLFHTWNHFHEISFSLASSRWKSQLAQGKMQEKRKTRARRSQMKLHIDWANRELIQIQYAIRLIFYDFGHDFPFHLEPQITFFFTTLNKLL